MPRTPAAKARVSGQASKNPQRHKPRKEPATNGLGKPSAWMTADQRAVWAGFVQEIPWLNESHRSLLEIAVTIRARLVAGEEVGVQALNLLRQCLGQMGATPADATKVSTPDGNDEEPEDKFFN